MVDTVSVIARRHAGRIVGAALLGLVAAASGLAQPIALGALLAAVAAGNPLLWPVVLVVALFVVEVVFTAFQADASGVTGERIVYDVRRSLVRRLLRVDMAAFGRLRQGDVLAVLVNDTTMIKGAVSASLVTIAVDGLMLVGALVLMAIIDLFLFGLTVGCLAVTTVVALLLARELRKAAVSTREAIGEYAAETHRVTGALSTVKASRAQDLEDERIGDVIEDARRSGRRVSAMNALLAPAMSTGVQASLAVVVVVGMSRVATGSLDIGVLTAFVLYLFYLISPLVGLFMGIGQFQAGRAAIARVDELAAVGQEREDPEYLDEFEPAERGDSVRFDGVTFGYDEERPVLSDVSFAVPARGLTAVVGPSGAGKTTVFELLLGFYPDYDGRILLGETDLASIPLDELRRHVGYVRQEGTAMRGTIYDNLVYARPDADDDEIAEVLRLARLEEVVDALPDGLDTELGDGGAGLSGGQRQRLAVARVLLCRPDVLLLDEATAHLDAESELALRTTVRDIAADRAVISVAHRLSTVVDADRIVVLDAGRVQAIGTHAELMACNDLYRRLVDIQFRQPESEPVLVSAGRG